jgi:hypothetical protein
VYVCVCVCVCVYVRVRVFIVLGVQRVGQIYHAVASVS